MYASIDPATKAANQSIVRTYFRDNLEEEPSYTLVTIDPISKKVICLVPALDANGNLYLATSSSPNSTTTTPAQTATLSSATSSNDDDDEDDEDEDGDDNNDDDDNDDDDDKDPLSGPHDTTATTRARSLEDEIKQFWSLCNTDKALATSRPLPSTFLRLVPYYQPIRFPLQNPKQGASGTRWLAYSKAKTFGEYKKLNSDLWVRDAQFDIPRGNMDLCGFYYDTFKRLWINA